MNNKIFQDIFDRIQNYLPVDWEHMIFFAGYTEGSYSMKFYTKDGKSGYLDCFNMQGITKGQLVKLFMDIDKVLSKERTNLDDKHKWSSLTMIVEADGTMKTEFDYEDHTEDMISYEKKWKEKYLPNL